MLGNKTCAAAPPPTSPYLPPPPPPPATAAPLLTRRPRRAGAPHHDTARTQPSRRAVSPRTVVSSVTSLTSGRYMLLSIFVFGYGLQLTWFQKIIGGLLAFLKKDAKKPESKKI